MTLQYFWLYDLKSTETKNKIKNNGTKNTKSKKTHL